MNEDTIGVILVAISLFCIILEGFIDTYYRNQRIKKEETKEKAKRQAEEEAERIRAKSQIWVSE